MEWEGIVGSKSDIYEPSDNSSDTYDDPSECDWHEVNHNSAWPNNK